MTSATALRIQIEHALERRFPAALTPVVRTIRETAATGIAAVDTLLEGGLPVGAISEVVGPQSSGRTSLALSFLAHRTQDGKVAAWVDAGDAFDPESAAANGVSLRQLLWVRCSSGSLAAKSKPWTRGKPWARLDQAIQATDLLLQAGGFAAIVLETGSRPLALLPGCARGASLCAIDLGPAGGMHAAAGDNGARNRADRILV